MVHISEKISSLRKAHNLTQEALGEAVGVSPQAVSKWEKGDSLPDILVCFCGRAYY
ncbi:MAG: helix-turn-helix domain-containing protein [Firmicutes bacterium]|nr:helix-turn-helix domain-containing protein [Bacillota bacterium]